MSDLRAIANGKGGRSKGRGKSQDGEDNGEDEGLRTPRGQPGVKGAGKASGIRMPKMPEITLSLYDQLQSYPTTTRCKDEEYMKEFLNHMTNEGFSQWSQLKQMKDADIDTMLEKFSWVNKESNEQILRLAEKTSTKALFEEIKQEPGPKKREKKDEIAKAIRTFGEMANKFESTMHVQATNACGDKELAKKLLEEKTSATEHTEVWIENAEYGDPKPSYHPE